MTQVGMNYDPSGRKRPPENGFVRIHCDLAQYDYLEWWLQKYPCIVPMRHPLAVAASWKAREKSLDDLAGQWSILKEHVDKYEPMYLPVDSPDRMHWLDTISRNIGQDLQTNWPVVMSCNKTATLNDSERDAVVEVMADGFFDRFGYEV